MGQHCCVPKNNFVIEPNKLLQICQELDCTHTTSQVQINQTPIPIGIEINNYNHNQDLSSEGEQQILNKTPRPGYQNKNKNSRYVPSSGGSGGGGGGGATLSSQPSVGNDDQSLSRSMEQLYVGVSCTYRNCIYLRYILLLFFVLILPF